MNVHKSNAAWSLARRQHGVIAYRQLLGLGFTRHAISHRIATRRLHAIHEGVYAVGRAELTVEGRFMAAVLACGPGAALSHEPAAVLSGFRTRWRELEVSVPANRRPRRPGIRIHRRTLRPGDVTRRRGIPVTTPALTLVDLAQRLPREELERAVNEADAAGVIRADTLRAAVDEMRGRHGARALRRVLDRHTFRLTDSVLEQRLLPLARAAGVDPLTRQRVNGHVVDFYVPELRLAIETHGFRYHRTVDKQYRDAVRAQSHAVGGVTGLPFTHHEIAHEPERVKETLRRAVRRLRSG